MGAPPQQAQGTHTSRKRCLPALVHHQPRESLLNQHGRQQVQGAQEQERKGTRPHPAPTETTGPFGWSSLLTTAPISLDPSTLQATTSTNQTALDEPDTAEDGGQGR